METQYEVTRLGGTRYTPEEVLETLRRKFGIRELPYGFWRTRANSYVCDGTYGSSCVIHTQGAREAIDHLNARDQTDLLVRGITRLALTGAQPTSLDVIEAASRLKRLGRDPDKLYWLNRAGYLAHFNSADCAAMRELCEHLTEAEVTTYYWDVKIHMLYDAGATSAIIEKIVPQDVLKRTEGLRMDLEWGRKQVRIGAY